MAHLNAVYYYYYYNGNEHLNLVNISSKSLKFLTCFLHSITTWRGLINQHIPCHSPRQDLCMSDAVNEDEQVKQTCWLTFGSLVNVACWDEDRQRCPQIKQDRYMRVCIIEIKKKKKI